MEEKRRRDPNSATKMMDPPLRETRGDTRRGRGGGGGGGVGSSPDSRGETPPARALDRGDRYYSGFFSYSVAFFSDFFRLVFFLSDFFQKNYLRFDAGKGKWSAAGICEEEKTTTPVTTATTTALTTSVWKLKTTRAVAEKVRPPGELRFEEEAAEERREVGETTTGEARETREGNDL